MIIIKTEADYIKVLERFEEIFHSKIGTPESDEADLLATLIEDYESKHYKIEKPTKDGKIQS